MSMSLPSTGVIQSCCFVLCVEWKSGSVAFMDVEAVAQLVVFVMAALGIVWHQQHSSDKIRDELHESNREHREDFNGLREGIVENGMRLARIEGHLGIGFIVPSDETAESSGEDLG